MNAIKPDVTAPILCGTDFSGNARHAANVAAALARHLGVATRLVHASAIPAFPDIHEDLQREAQRLQDQGTEVTAEVIEGPPAEVLAQSAQRHAARLIVLSSLGRSAPARWLFGSVAERTAESAPVPTLVVRDAEPFEAWARGERALRVFVGVDFSSNSDAAMRWVAELRRIGPVEVIAGYVEWPPKAGDQRGVSSPAGLYRDLPAGSAGVNHDLQEKVTRLLGSENVKVEVRGDWRFANVPLVEMATGAQADLIVVGTHQWHGLSRLRHDSISRGILHNAPISVCCVPAPAAAPMEGPRIRECRRVLVAVDLNEPHGFAAPHGYSIVQPGGTVRLLHNITSLHPANLRTDGGDPGRAIDEAMDRTRAEAEARLLSLAPDEAMARGITTEVEVTESINTAEAVCSAAERFGADVLCIGSHTRPGFNAKLLGSVSLAVLQRSACPVLVVWPPAK